MNSYLASSLLRTAGSDTGFEFRLTAGVFMIARWVWSLVGTGEFSVASVRKLIDDVRLPEVSSQSRWIKEVPIK
ncbi:hypothetical protein Tco_1086654, partial [Tanacetum coccineum]